MKTLKTTLFAIFMVGVFALGYTFFTFVVVDIMDGLNHHESLSPIFGISANRDNLSMSLLFCLASFVGAVFTAGTKLMKN